MTIEILRDYLIEDRIGKEIKANITCLMNNILIPLYSCELIECTGIIEDDEFKPAMEYYLVSEWLFLQLKHHNQPVTQFNNLYIWGRLGTGYSLKNETVLTEIFGG